MWGEGTDEAAQRVNGNHQIHPSSSSHLVCILLLLFTRRCNGPSRPCPAIRIFRLLLCGLQDLNAARRRMGAWVIDDSW